MFPSDEQFGDWVRVSQLGTHRDGSEIKRDERAAAMWAAANPPEFEHEKAPDFHRGPALLSGVALNEGR